MAVTISGNGQVVVQVVQAVKTDVSSTSSTSWADIDGLSVSITPKSATNKILVKLDLAGSNNTGGGHVKLVRGSTDIAVGIGGGSRVSATLSNFYNTDTNSVRTDSITYLDSPATTTSTTYKAQFRIGTGGVMTVNRNYSNADAAYTGCVVSSITLMEISGT